MSSYVCRPTILVSDWYDLEGSTLHLGLSTLGINAALLQESIDETGRRRIMLASSARVQLLLNVLRQALAQLNTPLVERVDVPDGALNEGEVLVVDDQRTESGRSDLLREDAGGGSVAQERLVGDELLRSVFSLKLLGCLSDHESLSLSQEVGSQHDLVLVVADGIVGLGGKDEVRGDELGALMKELVEGVLGVGGRLAEEDRTGGVLHHGAGTSNGLTVGLHGELLKVCGEA